MKYYQTVSILLQLFPIYYHDNLSNSRKIIFKCSSYNGLLFIRQLYKKEKTTTKRKNVQYCTYWKYHRLILVI